MTGSTAGAVAPRVVIVAGATRGIGRAAAGRLADGGWSVVVNYAPTSIAPSRRLTRSWRRGVAEAVRADVTDELDVERLFSETVESCGGVDAVVQAVFGGRSSSLALAEVGLEEFRL